MTPPHDAAPPAAESASAAAADAMRRFERPLLCYVGRILGDAEEARDVVQDVFLRFLGAPASRTEGRMAEWLYVAARNRALDVKRKKRPTESLDDGAAFSPVAPEPGPAERAAAHDDAAEASRSLATLPSLQQEAIRLRLGHGLSYREVGAVMGIAESYVGYLISVGLKTVRANLFRKDGARA